MSNEEFTIKVDSHRNTRTMAITAYMADELCQRYSPEILTRVWEIIAQKLADQVVAEHGAAIIAKLDQQAIANTAIAKAGHAVAQAIGNQPPVIINQRTGWF